ncbi:phage tail tip lysozyme [Enterovirga sp. CN4-39]|uniref:phage tail tip lysozyme n=1 Tax=Enterovirga sp. CN4-39 TaxID=3400910 RepID=UPI003C03FC53
MTPAFKERVEKFGPRFKTDLGLTNLQVAGMFGNFAVETGEFKYMQEIAPVVKGSKGGRGWAQWTGYTKNNPRRKNFEEWCAAKGLNPDHDEANYGFVVHELRGSEKAALAALKRTKTLDTAAETFMKKYERPGVPHLQKRKDYALEALHVLEAVVGVEAAGKAATAPKPIEAPKVQTVEPTGKKPGILDVLGSLFGRKPSKPAVPVLAESKGDPTIYYVQKMLRERAYYQQGFVDGLDGPMTQEAVSQARKDNGMGDGGVDDEFLRRLPSMPQRPVSKARAQISLPDAIKHAPEPASGGLTKIGAGILATILGAGTSDTVQQTLDGASKAVTGANDLIGQAQNGLATASRVVLWVVDNKTLILIGLGIWALLWGVKQLADFWAKVRAAWF